MGKVANKDRILAEAQLVCHSMQKIKPPFEIGEKIVMREKISFQQLRPFLTFPLFHSGPPSVTKVCQVSLAGGTSFLHCDLLPVEDDHGKIQKLVKFFQEKNWAGIVKCPDANRVIFLIPTSQTTLDLGITTVDSPAALHVLLFVKNQKSTKGCEINKAATSASVREKDLQDVNQIQKELKRQLSLQVEVKEKPTEHRKLSLDSARPAVASASNSKDPRDVPEFALQSNEQAVQWKNAVENWLSRPHPLGGTEADLQKAVASIDSALKIAHVPSAVPSVPKPRVPMAEAPLNIPFQPEHARSSGSTEQYRLISGQQDASAKSSVSAEEYKVISGWQDGGARLGVSTEEHRVISVQQDRHVRPSGNAEQHRLFSGKHGDMTSMEMKVDNVIKKDAKPSVTPVIIRKEEHREDPRLKIRRSLDEQPNTGLKSPNLPQISHGTPYNAEEALQAQSVVPVLKPAASSSPQLKYQVDDKSIRELLDKINVQKIEEPAYKVALNDGTRRALEAMKQHEGKKKSKAELPEAKTIVMDANTDGKLDTVVCSSDEKAAKRSCTSVSAAEENVKRIKINKVNPVCENMSTVKGLVPTPSPREELAKLGKKAKGVRQTPRDRSEKKLQKSSHVEEPQNPNDSSSVQETTKLVKETTVPELSEAPFPRILSPESLRSPPTSVLMSKAPKLKLILRSKESKEVCAQSPGNNKNSSEDAQAKQPSATEGEQKGDLERDRKLIDSPVSMDISPLSTTPTVLESVSPITVVSSKGRYQTTLPAQTPTTPVHSASSYPSPMSSSFPFTPPLPEGPYRSPILPQPRPPPPEQQPGHAMPFVPPLPAAASSETPPSLPGAPPLLKSPTVSSEPSGGSLPCSPPFQDALSFVPHSAITPISVSPDTSVAPTMGALAGNLSYPPRPSAHPGSVHRKSSIDALPGATSSSAVRFPATFPGQQWTGAPPRSQGFVASPPGVVPIPSSGVLWWPARPGLPRPVLPSAPGRPLHVFPQRLARPSQSTPFPGSLGEMTVRQPQGGGFVPRFHVPQVSPTRTAQIPPMRTMFGAVPVPRQFQPPIPFQQPSHIGYWVAPLKSPSVHSGITKGHVGRMPSHPPAKKHSKELQQTSPTLSQKNKEPSVEKAQTENKIQNKENSNDTSSEGLKSSVCVQKGDDKEKSNGQFEKQRDVEESKEEVINVDIPKENQLVAATSDDKKSTSSTDQEIQIEAVEGSVVDSAKKPSRETDEAIVQDSEKPSLDQTVQQEPLKTTSNFELASDCFDNKENQAVEGLPGESNRDDLTEQRSEGLQGSDGADSVSSKVGMEVEEPGQMVADEFKTSSSQDTTELPGNFGEEYIDVSVSDSIEEVVEIDCLPVITYQTEAERKGSKAKSKIYDILRQNAQQARSETDPADQEEVEDLDDPGKPDNPDPCVMDEDLNADDEGIAEEEKLLFSGEESTAGEQDVHLDSGLRVVQLLELDRIHDQDERACEESATFVSNVEHDDGQPQEELPSYLPSHENQQDMLPRDSEFEDISDVSDEGTPERDLPGYGSVDIEQLWSCKAVDTVHNTVPVTKDAPVDTAHSTVPVTEASPVDTVHSGVPVPAASPVDTVHSGVPVSEASSVDTVRSAVSVSEASPVDTVHRTVPVSEAAPVPPLKNVAKAKTEVVHKEADSSSSRTERHGTRRRHITVQSQKRKRMDSTSEDNDTNKYSSSSKRSKRNTHRRSSSRRKSPDRHKTASSSKKRERARRTSESSGVKSEPHSRRIVSGFKGGSLQITILQDTKSKETEVKEEKEVILPETQKNEEKNPLADVEYSDLEDISPGRLSSDDESPPTPPTPETAIPAVDFTHPSLGFWAAPLKTNEPAVSGSAGVEELQVSGKEILTPPTHPSRLEERPINVEPSQVRYPLGEMKFYEDEPFIGQSSWPAEGFFCQTTTSEERDLVIQGVEIDPFLLDDSAGHYLSRSSQESDEDIARYSQEFTQSEVFEYGHGVRDRPQSQEKGYRSSGHVQSREIQKEVKHRSTNRETRYPWKTREESKHGQVPSAGGEELASASQSATGKNTGCNEESPKHTAKRPKVVKGANSTNENEVVGDEVRDWEVYVFACMKKPQFENWIRRKNFAAKLAGKCNVILTPEQFRRSSERCHRRVKKQLRRTCQSSRPQTEHLETSDCPEFDFDDMDVESSSVKGSSLHKEQSCSSVSKELSQSDTVNGNNNFEICTVHSTLMEHPASPGTERSEVVHRHMNINEVDECNDETVRVDKMDDVMCDEEVPIILKQDVMDEVSTSKVVNDSGSVTSKLAGKDISLKTEQCCDGLLEDQATMCEEGVVRTSPTSGVEVGCIKQQDAAEESPVVEVLHDSTRLHSKSDGNRDKVIDGENEVVLGPGFEEVNDGQGGPSQEQRVVADKTSVSEAEVIQAVDLSLHTQHDQGVEGTPREVEEASLMHTKDSVVEDLKTDAPGSSQEGVMVDTVAVTVDHESGLEPTSVARRGIKEVENAHLHKDDHDGEDTTYSAEDQSVREGNKVESRMVTDDADDKPSFTATLEPQTNIEGNVDKAVVLEQDKTDSVESGKTKTTVTNRSLMMPSAVTSLPELSESQCGSSTAVVSTSNQPKALNFPALQKPCLNAVTTPIVPVTSCFVAFQPCPPKFVWPVVRPFSPIATTGLGPVHTPTYPQGYYGFDPSWGDRLLHAPIPVGCVRSHSTCEDICPPGTENMSVEASTESAHLAPGPETQEETCASTVDKQLHGCAMDTSVVTALMQFYSEIEEVQGSASNGVKGADDTTETNSAHSVPKSEEESTHTKSKKSNETASDMEVENDCEDSDKCISEDVEMSETGGVANLLLKRTEISIGTEESEGKTEEVESTGIVCSEVDMTVVENRVDRTGLENPVMMNPESTEGETLAKNPEVETEKAQVTKTCVTGDTTQVEYPNMTMSESLTVYPDNSVDKTLSENLATDEKVVENGTLAENANFTVDRTSIEKANATVDRTPIEKANVTVDRPPIENDSVPIETILAEGPDDAMNETQLNSLHNTVNVTQMEDPCIAACGTHTEEPPSKSILTEEHDVAMKETPVESNDVAVAGPQVGDPDMAACATHVERPNDTIMEALEEELSLSPIDPLFMASAEQTIFSSIGDLRNLLGQSSTFDRIAEEAIASTVSSLENVLRQAHNSYQESSSCPSDSGMSVGEDVSAPSRLFGNIPVSTISLQDGDPSTIGSVPGYSASSCLRGGMQPQVVTATARGNDRSGTSSYIDEVTEKRPPQKKIKPAGHRRFCFYVYSPEHDRECEAVKNYMTKAGGTFVDVKDSACLEENSRELKVFIRRKHLPAVHRLANLYQLKMLASVRFSLFNTLTDVIEGSRDYQNIFVSGGALLADDSILKTIDLDHLHALLRYLKEQSLSHQKFVWVLNISRNGYKKLSLSRPQTKRDSKVLNLIRQYREEGHIAVLQKGYVAEGMPAAQRYLQTSLKLQIDLITVYRHVILLSDMDKNRMELPWFLERGIGVMNVQEFLTTFAGEREATRLLTKRQIPEVTVKEPSTVPYCSTPEDETVCHTPEGTPVSDSSNDSPYTENHALELPRSTGAPQKRAVRSLSLDAGTMTHTRLHILSCVRSVRDNIRSQISSSSPSSPVGRSM